MDLFSGGEGNRAGVWRDVPTGADHGKDITITKVFLQQVMGIALSHYHSWKTLLYYYLLLGFGVEGG